MAVFGGVRWFGKAVHLWVLTAVLALFSPGQCQASRAVTLAWDPPVNGSDVFGYNLYYGTASRAYSAKITVGTNTSATVENLVEGQTYYFAATSCSASGLESDYSEETVFFQAPAAFTNLVVDPTDRVRLAIPVPSGSAYHRLLFQFAATPPDGASINSTNGMFSWTPSRSQASSTNYISFTVTDLDQPSLSQVVTLTVVVGDSLVLGLGSTCLQAGQTGSIPLSLFASEGTTAFRLAIDWPVARLVSPALVITAPGVESSSAVIQGGKLLVSLRMAPDQVLLASNQVGFITFQAAVGQSSTFARFSAAAGFAIKPSGELYGNCSLDPGEVAIVGNQALLKALPADNYLTRSLALYGKPGATYELQSATSLARSALWTKVSSYTQTSLIQTVAVPAVAPQVYYRLVQK